MELRVLLLPPSLPPLFSQCEAHGPPIGVGREKKGEHLPLAFGVKGFGDLIVNMPCNRVFRS